MNRLCSLLTILCAAAVGGTCASTSQPPSMASIALATKPVQQPVSVSGVRGPYLVTDLNQSATFYLGASFFDEDFWAPLEDMFSFGFVYDNFRNGDFLGWELGFNFTYDQSDVNDPLFGNVDVSASTFELYGGARKTFPLAEGRLNPYVGAGPTVLFADISADQGSFFSSDGDISLGAYAHGGLYWLFPQGLTLGADYRIVFWTDIDISGASGDADYQQVTATIGFRF